MGNERCTITSHYDKENRSAKQINMGTLAIVAGLILILIILTDVFETVVLPRRVTRRIRLTGLF